MIQFISNEKKENGKEFIDPMCSAFKKDYASLILYTSAKMKLHIQKQQHVHVECGAQKENDKGDSERQRRAQIHKRDKV